LDIVDDEESFVVMTKPATFTLSLDEAEGDIKTTQDMNSKISQDSAAEDNNLKASRTSKYREALKAYLQSLSVKTQNEKNVLDTNESLLPKIQAGDDSEEDSDQDEALNTNHSKTATTITIELTDQKADKDEKTASEIRIAANDQRDVKSDLDMKATQGLPKTEVIPKDPQYQMELQNNWAMRFAALYMSSDAMIPMSETSNFTDTMLAIFDHQKKIYNALQLKTQQQKKESDLQNQEFQKLKADMLKVQSENQLLKSMQKTGVDVKAQAEIHTKIHSNPTPEPSTADSEKTRKRKGAYEADDVIGMKPTTAAASADSANSTLTFKKVKQ
jgi:hypothetical protein